MIISMNNNELPHEQNVEPEDTVMSLYAYIGVNMKIEKTGGWDRTLISMRHDPGQL